MICTEGFLNQVIKRDNSKVSLLNHLHPAFQSDSSLFWILSELKGNPVSHMPPAFLPRYFFLWNFLTLTPDPTLGPALSFRVKGCFPCLSIPSVDKAPAYFIAPFRIVLTGTPECKLMIKSCTVQNCQFFHSSQFSVRFLRSSSGSNVAK